MDLLFAAAGGVLLSAAQPPLVTVFLAYFCLVPLLVALRNKSYRGAFLLAYLYAFVSNLLSLYWIALPTFAGMVGAVVILSLYNGLFGLVFSFIERRSFPLALASAPILWTAMEFIRGFGRIGFPWMDLGYTQGPYVVIIQMADIIGHRGISFWLVVINVLILTLVISRRRKWLAGLALLVIAALPIGYGLWRLNQPPAQETVTVALMQGNIPAKMKWEGSFRRKNIQYYAAMIDTLADNGWQVEDEDEIARNDSASLLQRDRGPTKQSHQTDIDLIALPETATGHYHKKKSWVIYELTAASKRAGAPILSGTLDYDLDNRQNYYNAAFVVSEKGATESYHKMILVPMSEQIPWDEKFSFLRKLDLGGSHFSPGKTAMVFDIEGMKFSTPICYEIAFARSARRFAKNGARFLITITNDGWFGVTPGPYQHANFCRFRAVENRFGIGRAAQTGISLIIDEKGRIIQSLPLNAKGAIVGDIPLKNRDTFFTKAGDWVAYGSLFASPILIILAGFLKKI